jgi:inner membrane protein
MDSLSQLALGAACSVAVMGRRTAVWKAALWGGLAGTLPDLDALIDLGDAVRNMTEHRGLSHGLLMVTLVAPVLGTIASRVHREGDLLRRWCLAMWLALFTHPLLDTLTIYGTQLLQPFSSYPFGVGSMFIIDPLYTLPLLIGLGVALGRRQFAGLRANAAGLALSTLYLAWSVLAQTQVEQRVRAQLAREGQASAAILVTPTPLNTVAWRVVVMQPGGYREGFYSLLDGDRPIRFDTFPSQTALLPALGDNPGLQRMVGFTHGFFGLREEGGRAILADLRMGQEPFYVFQFALARREGDRWVTLPPEPVGSRGDVAQALPWLWARIKGHDVPPPREP